MAKISLCITPNRSLADGSFTVYTQISANKKNLRTPTGVTVLKEHWDKKAKEVISGKKGDPLAGQKNTRLQQIINSAEVKMLQFPEKVERMDVKQLKAYLLNDDHKSPDEAEFFSYCRKAQEDFKSLGKTKSASLFDSTENKVKEFWGNNVLPFPLITAQWLEKFEHYCMTTPVKSQSKKKDQPKEKYMTQGGVNVYLRYIRTIINQAIADELPIRYPFRKFRIKAVKTKNRNLSLEFIRAIKDLQPTTQREQLTKDILLLQVYLSGINVADIWLLEKSCVQSGRIQFYRAKTGRYHNIKIEPEASLLIEKYKGSERLFWFSETIRKKGNKKTADLIYKDEPSFLKMINRTLVNIQKSLGILEGVKITDYWIRHSVATIIRTEVKVNGVTPGVSDVAFILGHKEVEHKVTGTYINQDYEGNDAIIRALIDLVNAKMLQ